MKFNFHDQEGYFRHAGKPASRQRMILISLMLALTFGSATQPKPVEAAQGPADWVDFRLKVAPEKPPTICVGQAFYLFAYMEQTNFKTLTEKDEGYLAPPSSDPNVTGRVVIGPGTLLGILNEGDTQTTFVFKSDKPGDTTLKFSAFINSSLIGPNRLMNTRMKQEATVNLKIRRCKFKAATIGAWNIPGQASGYVAATSNDAEIKAADPQSPFTGSTSVNWVASVGSVRDCSGVATIGSSKLDWNGTMNDSGQLTLNGNFQTAAVDFQINCRGETDSMQFEMTPDPVTLTISSSGGTVNQAQTLEWEGANPGQITIIIFPVEDTGVAFIPRTHALPWANVPHQFAARLPLLP